MIGQRYDIPAKLAPAIHISAALRSFFGADATRCTYEQSNTSTGKSAMRWYAVKEASECRTLATGMKRKRPNPGQKQRDAVFPIVLRALAIREKMEQWAHGEDFYAITGQRAGFYAIDRQRAPENPSKCIGIPGHLWDMAACAIACGHLPVPRMTGGVPFLQEVAGFTSLKRDIAPAEVEIRKRYEPGYIARAITIPGAEPEEHPFFYARQALYHLAECKLAAIAATKNPTGLFKGKYGRSAIVSRTVAERHPEALKRHLSGMPL